jgi:hypothetical protein
MTIVQVEHMILTCTYLNSHLLEAPPKYVLHGPNPGLDWASFWSPSSNVFLVCYGPFSILLFVSTDWVSHPIPSLLSRRLLTNVQVNNITTLHDTHGHTNIHHIGITILLPFYTSSTLLDSRLVQTLPIWHNTVLDTSSVEVPRQADGGVSYLL